MQEIKERQKGVRKGRIGRKKWQDRNSENKQKMQERKGVEKPEKKKTKEKEK